MSKIQTQHGQPANYNETLPSLSDEDASSLNVDGRGILKVKQSENVSSADAKLIARTTIVFASGDNLTTEKTATITITDEDLHPDGLYILAVEKAAENTAGNMTLKIYDSVKIDGTNARDALLTTLTVESITDTAIYRCYLIQGLFPAELSIKVGAYFATDSGAITPKFALYRV